MVNETFRMYRGIFTSAEEGGFASMKGIERKCPASGGNTSKCIVSPDENGLCGPASLEPL